MVSLPLQIVDLLSAYEKRHIPTLERRLNRARACNYNNILDSEIVLASRLLERLNSLKNLRKEVMMTDTKALTELKRYTAPPAGIHEVMSCTLLLLGHPPWEIDVSINTATSSSTTTTTKTNETTKQNHQQ